MGVPQAHRRQQTIVCYLAGDKIAGICRDLHCVKSWLYKWKARYRADDPGWGKGRSTQPRRKPSQTPPRLAQTVVTSGWALVQSGKRGSARAIQQGLTQPGIEPIPSLRTISRILQRHAKGDI